MKHNLYQMIIASLLLLSLAACAQTPGSVSTQSAGLETITAQSIQLTQLVATLNSLLVTDTATPNPLAQTEISSTETPTSNILSTDTPTPGVALTSTPLSGVWLIFDENTNCRLGPAGYYPILVTINAGEKGQAVARTLDGQYYYMRYIDTSTHYCWVPIKYAIQSGDSSYLPMYTIQPTNTPTITPTADFGFRISYSSVFNCSSNYSVALNVTNSGNLTWQSIKIVIDDSTKGTTTTYTSNNFTSYSGCTITQAQDSLSSGQSVLVANVSPGAFTYDPTGDTMTIVVSLYSGDGITGTSLSKEIVVTP